MQLIALCCRGKYNNYVINDIVEGLPQLFVDAIQGKVQIEREWVSREEFLARKDKEPLIVCVWSFGNDCKTYLYLRRKEKPSEKAAWEFACSQ